MPDKNLRKGTVWTIVFFVVSFAKTLVLTPLMLYHWGSTVFCFWAVVLSARALILFLSDGFVRYISNEYNILSHTNEAAARKVLQAGLAFLTVFSAVLCLAVFGLFTIFPGLGYRFFDVSRGVAQNYHLAFCLCVYLLSACVQNIGRMYAGTKEARGLVWHNMVLELAIVAAELVVMALLLVNGLGFTISILADSLLIFSFSLAYLLRLRVLYPLPATLKKEHIIVGGQQFLSAGKLYASNFFERLSSDGLVLLLSFFRFDKSAIALFATIRTMVNTPLLAQNLLLGTYTPELQKNFALRNEQGLQKLFTAVRLKVGLFLLAGIVFCFPLYEPVFNFWTKGAITFNEDFMLSMLVMTIFNLYGLSFAFVLKGLNILPYMLGMTVVKAILVFTGFYLAQQNIVLIGWALASTECISSVFILPLMLHRFWQRQELRFDFNKNILLLLPYLLAAVSLLLLA